MSAFIVRAIFVGLPFLALSFASVPQANAKTINVNCAIKSLQPAVDRAHPGDTIRVSGTCNERVTIRVDRLTLDGQGSAVMDGTGLVVGNGALLRVRANDVSIRNFTIQNGPNSGIQVQRSGSAVIEGNTVQDNAGSGILVNTGSYAQIGAGSG